MTLVALPPYFPLAWPEGWTRTHANRRARSPYKQTYVKARQEAERHLRAFSASARFVITTNIPKNMSGEPDDPGVSAWWLRNGASEPRAIACDKWSSVRENMRALAVTLEAFRTMERAGATQVLEQAMRSFGPPLLPANNPTPARPATWWVGELGLYEPMPGHYCYLGPGGLILRGTDAVEAAYVALARERHPDRGGTDDAFVRLGQARTDALMFMGEAGGGP